MKENVGFRGVHVHEPECAVVETGSGRRKIPDSVIKIMSAFMKS